MKVVIIGGGGQMAKATIMDLLRSRVVQKIMIADYNFERAKKRAES